MKRILSLALVAAFILGAVSMASAVELKVKGDMRVTGLWHDNWNFRSAKHGGNYEDDFQVYERARIEFRFIANENLWGVFRPEFGSANWGSNGVFSLAASTAGTIEVKEAYVQFRWPDTNVLFTGGFIGTSLPNIGDGSIILDDEVATLNVVAPLIEDNLALALGFIRAYDFNTDDGASTAATTHVNDEFDVIFAALPISYMDVSFAPFFAYGWIGSSVPTLAGLDNYNLTGLLAQSPAAYTDNAKIWWAGGALKVDILDPFYINVEFDYGALDADQKQNDRKGYFVNADIGYNGLDMVKPKIFFAYSSGDDDESSNGSERMPILREAWSQGSFFFGSSWQALNSDIDDQSFMGFWTVGISLNDITFLEGLTHDVHYLYIKGTNSADAVRDGLTAMSAGSTYDFGHGYGRYLTTKDSLHEVDLNTQYKIYEELTAVLELGWIHASLDDDTWENTANIGQGTLLDGGDDALKCALGLSYDF